MLDYEAAIYVVRLLFFTITMISHHVQEGSADFIGLCIRFSNPTLLDYQLDLGINQLGD